MALSRARTRHQRPGLERSVRIVHRNAGGVLAANERQFLWTLQLFLPAAMACHAPFAARFPGFRGRPFVGRPFLVRTTTTFARDLTLLRLFHAREAAPLHIPGFCLCLHNVLLILRPL